MGSCLEVLSKAWKGGNINMWVWVVKKLMLFSLFPPSSLQVAFTLPPHLRWFGRVSRSGLVWRARHVGPNKQTLICPLYEYSDTAVCDTQIAAGELGPPQIPWCHAWTEAAASGPRQAHDLPRSHQWHPQHMVVSSINTFSSPRQTGGDTFRMLPRRWRNSRMWQMKEFDHFIIASVAAFESWFAIDTQRISRDGGQ